MSLCGIPIGSLIDAMTPAGDCKDENGINGSEDDHAGERIVSALFVAEVEKELKIEGGGEHQEIQPEFQGD